MAEFTELDDPAKLEKAKFIQLQNSLFPDGEIPSASDILKRLQTPDHTLRDVIIGKMYYQGVPIAPFLHLSDPDTMEFAQKFVKAFDQGTGGKLATSINAEVNSYLKNDIPLDTKYSDAILITKPTKKTGVEKKVVKDELESFKKKILAKPREFLETRTIKGSKKLIDGLLPDEILDDVLEGIKKIDDPLLKDAVLATLLGYRGEALTQSFATKELATTRTAKPKPYYVPETATFVNPEIKDKKGYGPDKELGPLFKSIMDRRHAAALQGKTGDLFPKITTGKITKVLQDTVFKNIRPEILAQLNRIPNGYTDMRRIVASVIANRLGDKKAAAAIIGHAAGEGDIGVGVMAGYYTDVVDEVAAEARKDMLFAFEGAMAKALGGNTFQDLAGTLGLPISDLTKDVTYPTFKKGVIAGGFSQQQENVSPEEIEKRKQVNLATMDEDIAGKKLSAAKKTKEKVELYQGISEEDIVKTGEKEALLEQTKTDTKTKLRSVQREEQKKKNKADAIEKNKRASKEAGDFFNDLFGPKVTKMESMMDTSGVKIGPTGEAVIEDKGLNVNIPNLSGLPPAIKAGTALLQGQEADKEVAAGFLGDVVRDSLIETGVAVGTKVLGAGKTLAAGLGGAATFLIDPNFPGQGKMGDQTLFGDKFEKLSPEQRQELGLKDSFLTTN